MTEQPKEDHQALAIEEDEVWKQLKGVHPGAMEDVVGRALGRSPSMVKVRRCLFQAKSDASPIWDAIEAGMLPRTGYRIYHASVKQARVSGRPLKDVIVESIAREADKSVRARHVPEPPASDPGPELPPPSSRPPRPAPRPPRPADRTSVPSGPWKQIRSALQEIVRDRLKGADQSVIDDVMIRMTGEIQRTMIWMHNVVAQAAKAPRIADLADDTKTRKNVLSWCKRLKITPPKPGCPVDDEELKRKHRAAVRMLHPDRHPGNEEVMNAKMAEVNAAVDGLCAYNCSLETDT